MPVPPTVDTSPAVVRRGDAFTIQGYAVPGNTVHIEIDGVAQKDTIAKSDGSYQTLVASGVYGFGKHDVRARQSNAAGDTMTDFSPTVSFTVSQLAVPSADLNGDGVVDAQDLSMFLARWFSTDATMRKTADLNGDGKIDLSDFSILIRTLRR